LGVIPHGTTEEKQTMLHDPRSPIAEAFRAVRVNMQYLAAGLDKRVIGVTSSVPGEGKSFCTVNLAAELAQSGRRVIVLECDMRRPTLAGYFGIDPRREHGLSTYLADQSTSMKPATPPVSRASTCCAAAPCPKTPLAWSKAPGWPSWCYNCAKSTTISWLIFRRWATCQSFWCCCNTWTLRFM
ncbi:MAG: tyrosine-protein kinase family protein, partial [Hymenobacter sp.]